VKRFLSEYFTFNKSERNGIFVLLSIIVLQLIYLTVSPYFVQSKKVDFSDFEKQNPTLNASAKPLKKTNSKNASDEYFSEESVVVHYFVFNPNTASDDDWKSLGLSNKQIKTINNYKSKGGKFFKKEDFKKIYGISEKQYLKLEPYLEFANKKSPPVVESANRTTHSLMVELNAADSLQLISLKGIGPFYAKAILKYRTQLGGFYSKSQLLELWKFDEEKLDRIVDVIEVDSTAINKININTCTTQQLKHPYLNWNQVNAIINYRKKHGDFKTINEIKNTSLISEENYRKISHYLTTQ